MVIIKPDTPSGHAAAKKREQFLRENKIDKIETIFYDPLDPRWQPGTPSYIGPKKIVHLLSTENTKSFNHEIEKETGYAVPSSDSCGERIC